MHIKSRIHHGCGSFDLSVLSPAEQLRQRIGNVICLFGNGTHVGRVLQPQRTLDPAGYPLQDDIRTIRGDGFVRVALHHQDVAGHGMQIPPGHADQTRQVPSAACPEARITTVVFIRGGDHLFIPGMPPYRLHKGRRQRCCPKGRQRPHGCRNGRYSRWMQLLRQNQRQAAAHAEAGNTDIITPFLELQKCILRRDEPVIPGAAGHVVHVRCMAGQIDAHHREALRMQFISQQTHMRRTAGKAVNQQHAMVFSVARLPF